jgi:hypothetical protein
LLTNQILPNWHDESKPRNTGILDAAPPDRHPLPADNADLVSAVMRAQLTGLKALIDAILTLTAATVDSVTTGEPTDPAAAGVSVVGDTLHFTFTIPRGTDGAPGVAGPPGEVSAMDLAAAIGGTSSNTNSVANLTLYVSDPPQQMEVQAIADKLDELINALRRV